MYLGLHDGKNVCMGKFITERSDFFFFDFDPFFLYEVFESTFEEKINKNTSLSSQFCISTKIENNQA